MQPKMAMAAQKKMPAAPPVYRPQATPKTAQPKMANGSPNRQPPVAPPVYRPQPVPKVLQTKSSSAQSPQAGQAPRQPVAPPVYRPQPNKLIQQTRIAQPKMASAAPLLTRPTAPTVYRPQPKPLIAPTSLPVHTRAASASVPIQAKTTGQGRPERNLPARPDTSAKNTGRAPAAVLQRSIKLDGQEKYWDQIMDFPFASHLSTDAKTILKRWADQQTIHKFVSDSRSTAAAKLFAAAEEAADLITKGDTVVKLFNAQNLKFITKTPDRKPTLYFISGDQSGRLRQTHGSGPKLGMEQGKTDFFYTNEADLRTFHEKMSSKRKAREAPGLWEWTSELLLHNSMTAQEGDFHLEVTRDQNGVVKNTHVSGGRYSSDISAYNDDWISRNIMGIVGLAEGIPGL